ncbi:hypothetical protein HNR60_003309 [Rhodopseudomonas rhenobacensis]|uniref:Uncharacterized protein n=1 Tax=Rhodopseudomonas rhenobacensis TaxID=87461 RepID=A0A7W8E053_9BRAD|nr:hypothetical protein [Rhodopseudomonas rhenobacensis]MBB5048542.1 hypothetical protein [Rhodopseudomonas rhenobacensis]
MSAVPFTRPTIIAAVAFLDANLKHHAPFNHMVLRLGLENEITSDTGISVSKKADTLGRIVVQRPGDQVDTLEGSMSLAEAFIREAVQLMRPEPGQESEIAFARGLARDGYVVSFDERDRPALRVALPEELGLPAVDDEVHELLKHFGFSEPLGHLGQGIEAHARGDWAAANAQFRTFLEGLFDDIARHCEGADKTAHLTSENRRALLAKINFLAEDRNEWTQDGKNYINGLFKMLHTDGSHPGLSDEDHSTFRLHIILVTARAFLRRLRYQQ